MDFKTVSRRNFIAGGLALAAVNVVGTGRAAAGVGWAGSGTLEDPYVVTDLGELQAMGNVPSAHFVLGNDIDASRTAKEGFVPLGDSGTPFSGTLDGQSYTIDGPTINRPGERYVGLFGYSPERSGTSR